MTTTRIQRKRSRRSRKPVEASESLDVFCLVQQLGGWQAWRELAARVDAMFRPVTQEEFESGEPLQGTEAEPPVRDWQESFAFEELID